MVEYLFYQDSFFWTVYLPLVILYCSLISSIRMGKLKIREGSKKWFTWIGIGLGILIGVITYQGDLQTKLGYGAGLYGFVGMIIPSVIISENIIPQLFRTKDDRNPIKKLRIDNEYIKILSDYVTTLEDLVSEDTSTLAQDTGLTMETIISFKRKAKNILNFKR